MAVRWSKSEAEASAAGALPVLVLAPTRELATQIQTECERFAPAKVSSMAIFGGTAKKEQAKELKKRSPQVPKINLLKSFKIF